MLFERGRRPSGAGVLVVLVAFVGVGLVGAGGCSHDWSLFEGTGGAASMTMSMTGGGGQAGGATSTGGSGGTTSHHGGGGAATGGSGGSVSTGGGGGSGGAASTGGGGSGGASGTCGNGTVEAGEECDRAGDGCTDCKVDCGESGAFKDPTSHHCYWAITAAHDFTGAGQACHVDNHATLAALSSTTELGTIGGKFATTSWIGGSWNGSAWVWSNGETWSYGDDQGSAAAPWTNMHGENHTRRQCVSLDGATGIDAQHCDDQRPSICERVP